MNNTHITFDWRLLWPDLISLFSGNISTTNGFSAFIVLCLWIIFWWAVVYVALKFKQAYENINFYKNLIKDLTQENILQNRRNIRNKSQKDGPENGQLWIEFDQSIVESSDGKRLYNPFEAAYFFNTYTLSQSLIENRMLAAVPGFLTAIGVIGTFAGLQLGLSGLDLSDEGMKAASHEINRLISSAAVAFLTSVWGVLTSLVFNFFEKFLERFIRQDIVKLQNSIDRLFPRINAEQTLISINEHNKQIRESMQGLAEKIGDKMQEAVDHVSQGVQGGIKEIMAPAIEQFVIAANEMNKRQAKGSEQALAALLENFMAGVSQESSAQRTLSEKLNMDLNKSIEKLINQLDNYSEQSMAIDKERFTRISETIEDVTKKQSSAIDYAVSQTTNTANDFAKGIDLQFERLAKQEEERIKLVNTQLKSLRESLQLFMVSINQSTEQNINASKEILQQGWILSESVERSHKSMDLVSKRIEKSGNHLDQAASNLEYLGESLGEVVKLFAESLLETSQTSTQLTKENTQVSSQITQLISTIEGLKNDFVKVSNVLGQSSGELKKEISSFAQHHQSFQNTLKEHVNELEEQVSKLLSNYSAQVQSQTTERLNEWNRQTSEFASTMKDAIYAISDVVNDIEDKIQVSK